MLKLVDRILSVLLALGACGHTLGSIKAYAHQPVTLLWALCASLLALLLAWLNWLRAVRTNDRTLAWTTVAGTAAYLATVIAFGALIGNLMDPRVVGFTVICVGLIATGIGSAATAGRASA